MKNRRYVLLSGQAMNPTIRTVEGLERVAAGLRDFGVYGASGGHPTVKAREVSGGSPTVESPTEVRRVGAPVQALIWTGGLLLLLLSVAVAVTIGPARISVPDVWSAVASHLGFGASELSPIRDGIIWNLRMPRTLLAAVAARDSRCAAR
ncbi:hypothetical protein SMICM304S_01535 [Streptomyces microflavus]